MKTRLKFLVGTALDLVVVPRLHPVSVAGDERVGDAFALDDPPAPYHVESLLHLGVVVRGKPIAGTHQDDAPVEPWPTDQVLHAPIAPTIGQLEFVHSLHIIPLQVLEESQNQRREEQGRQEVAHPNVAQIQKTNADGQHHHAACRRQLRHHRRG